MSIKIYNKRGNINYKERKLLKELEEALEKKALKDPTVLEKFKTADNYDELVHLHSEYCIDDATILSEKPNAPAEPSAASATPKTAAEEKASGEGGAAMDPMNEANPIVRPYVLQDSFEGSKKPPVGGQPNISEPTSYDEAFRLPDEDLDPKARKERLKEEAAKKSGGLGSAPSGGGAPPKKEGGINPAFDELTNARKKKQTRRFAKYIVQIVALGLENGYIWWVTKDINEAKLAEYELANKIIPEHMSWGITLSNEQEVTIRQFFEIQCATAKANAPVSQDDQDELADALADVLEEKGIAPTPTQNLIIVALGVVAKKALPALTQKSQTDIILNRLFDMAKKEKQARGEHIVNPENHQRNRAQNPEPGTQNTEQAEPGMQNGETDQQPGGDGMEGEPVTERHLTVVKENLPGEDEE